jgi:hypothetical protein
LNIYKFEQKECFTTSLKLGAKLGADENESPESSSFPHFLCDKQGAHLELARRCTPWPTVNRASYSIIGNNRKGLESIGNT